MSNYLTSVIKDNFKEFGNIYLIGTILATLVVIGNIYGWDDKNSFDKNKSPINYIKHNLDSIKNQQDTTKNRISIEDTLK